jgi:hypothetical protein
MLWDHYGCITLMLPITGVHAVIGAGHPISVVITRLYVYPSYLIIGVFLLKNEVAYSFNMQLHCMQLVTG